MGPLLLLTALVGCMTTPVQRAETLGKGNFEFALEPGVGSGPVAPAQFNIAARFGASDRVDVGFRIGSGIYQIQTKFLLTNPESESVRVSLAPYFTPFFFSVDGAGVGFLSARVPVLIGVPLGEHELVLGPAVNSVTVFAGGGGESGGVQVFEVGGSLGLSLQLGDAFRLHPEFGVLTGAAGASGIDDDFVLQGLGFTRVNFALGLQFGNFGG